MVSTTLVKTSGAVLLAGALGGLAGRTAQSGWYEQLRKPGFQPPRQAFPIVWPLLYADVAVVSAGTVDQLNDRGEQSQAKLYSILLALNLILNGSWTWLFFSRRRLGASAVAAATLTVSSADLTRRAVRTRGAGAGVLGLYPLWCAFATLLSSRIWWLNRSDR
jgi:tryptophan-rich sensory protein